MNDKFIKIIAIIFILLAAAVIFPWLLERKADPQSQRADNVSANLSGFTKESVSKIIIRQGNAEKVLSLKGGQWSIGGNVADEQKIESLFQDFADLKIKEMASDNKDNYEKFEVTKDKGLQLIITQDGKYSAFFIGKAGAATDDFYLRKDGIKNVYLVNGTLRDKLTWEADEWQKKAEDEKATKDQNQPVLVN